MRKERVGFAMCGSFCTHEKVLAELEKLVQLYETVIPIASEISAFTDTRFGTSDDLMERLEDLTGHEVLCDIPVCGAHRSQGAAGCSGDRPGYGEYHSQAGGGHHRYGGYDGGQGPSAEREAGGDCHGQQRRPGGWRRNIGELLVRKNYYFVPFGQDNARAKPSSLVADFSKIPETVEAALRGEQIQPLLLR